MCGVLFLLAGLAAGVYCLWDGIRGLASGVVVDSGRHHSTAYARATAPLEYWLTECGLLFVGVLLTLLFAGGLSRKLRPARGRTISDGDAPPEVDSLHR